MKFHFLLVCLCATGIGQVQAEIYKSVDAEGHVTYSSTPSKGAKRLGLEPAAPSLPAAAPSSEAPPRARARSGSSPADFPRVDSSTQKSRDSVRRKILADELAAEEKLLSEARASLKDAELQRSAPKYEEKLKSLRAEVTLHEKNISALKTELSRLK